MFTLSVHSAANDLLHSVNTQDMILKPDYKLLSATIDKWGFIK